MTLDRKDMELLPLVKAYMCARKARSLADAIRLGKPYLEATMQERVVINKQIDERETLCKAENSAEAAYYTAAKKRGYVYGRVAQDKLAELITYIEVRPLEVIAAEVIQTASLVGVEQVTLYRCEACSALCDDAGEGPLYECQQDGTIFTRENSGDGISHRCPMCNKFASRLADISCCECNEGPVEEVPGAVCPDCDDRVALEDWVDHQAIHGLP